MSRKNKILYIHHGVGIGGAPISLRNLLQHLDKEKFEVKVACLVDGEHVKLFEDAGIETEVIGCSTSYFSHTETGRTEWYYFFRYFKILFYWIYTAYFIAPKFLREKDFDLLHLNSHVLTSWAFAARKMEKRVVLHNREAITKGYLGIRYRILKKLIRNNCHHIVNISKDNQDRLGIYKNSSVVYNFIDIPESYIEPMNDSSKIKKVLYLGGTASIKGFEEVAQCVRYLDENITLQFAGKIEKCGSSISFENLTCLLKDFLKSKSKLLRLLEKSNKCNLIGLLKDPYPYINECDILITPFQKPHFSRPAIEAFSYGKPVVGTSVAGMDEIIDNRENGILVKKDFPLELAKAINYLCSNPTLARRLGKKGRNKAFEVFSPESNIRKVEDIYSDLI